MPSEIRALDRPRGDPEALDALIRRAQHGDEEAFGEILGRFESRALAIARNLGASREDAEEIAQEAFIKLFRHVRSYRGGRSFTSYFYRIVVNAARDYGARRRRGAEVEVQEDPRHPEAASRAGGEDLARREEVRQALMQLTEREREVVVLRELQGLSTWEVARALRLNPVTVRRHWMRARRRLKELLRL